MTINQTKTEHNVASFTFEFTSQEVDAQKETIIDEMIKHVTVKGFRIGKAPKDIASSQLDPEKVTDRVLNSLLNESVKKAIADHKLQLLGRPVLEKIDPTKDGGWSIFIDFPLYPEVKLGDYKKLIKDSTKKITEKDENKAKQLKIDAIYDQFLKDIKLEIPSITIDEEVHHSIHRLEDQAKNLNLSLDQYLKAVGKTLEEIKKDYAVKSEESIKLDLILLAIAKEEKIDTPKDEVISFAKNSGLDPQYLNQIKSMLDRQKTVEYLLSV